MGASKRRLTLRHDTPRWSRSCLHAVPDPERTPLCPKMPIASARNTEDRSGVFRVEGALQHRGLGYTGHWHCEYKLITTKTSTKKDAEAAIAKAILCSNIPYRSSDNLNSDYNNLIPHSSFQLLTSDLPFLLSFLLSFLSSSPCSFVFR